VNSKRNSLSEFMIISGKYCEFLVHSREILGIQIDFAKYILNPLWLDEQFDKFKVYSWKSELRVRSRTIKWIKSEFAKKDKGSIVNSPRSWIQSYFTKQITNSKGIREKDSDNIVISPKRHRIHSDFAKKIVN